MAAAPSPPRSRDGRRRHSSPMEDAGRVSAPAAVTVTASAAPRLPHPLPPPPPPPTRPHPTPPRSMKAIASARMKGEYPERVGQPECQNTELLLRSMSAPSFMHVGPVLKLRTAVSIFLQYYLKTGTCKFGPTCKFHHPREKAGIAGRVQLNTLGYPLRPRENVFPERPDQPECQYYMKTGDCKFGAVCKFHHPRVRTMPAPDCVLSPMGLPLRPVRVGRICIDDLLSSLSPQAYAKTENDLLQILELAILILWPHKP
ncbi:hypothetical protein PR202_gb03962 [Eleusine coracana subsp. coracana]|uniref:C3H1-type domain-containing protein n=1 Tax=Eleusine coracana subsp. coracana TaxID=191504 RepID=A0AAV5E0V7_ELECO|nr:hypothetical protein PR202_gb03962 [Eleusine coracana subsp. coracana]